MGTKKFHPINRNITVTILIYAVLMCVGLSFITYRVYTTSFYNRYKTQMESILTYVQQYIDDDDMSECASTYVESPKYKETREHFDNFIDNYGDIHYLYIVKVLEPDDPVKMRSVLAANSTYEKENEPENVINLGDGDETWYDERTTQKFREILNGNEDVYFLQPSAWGVDYTLGRPLINSQGVHYAVLCVDISLDELKDSLYKSIFMNITFIVLYAVALVLLLIIWIRVHVTVPLQKLDDSVKDYADSSHGQSNPDQLIFKKPEFRINNEIMSLSESIYKMSTEMRDYAKNNATAEKKVAGLKGYVSKINDVAYCDPLTKVKNRAAYDKKVEELETDIFNQMAQFAIVMADLNNLKKINDEYGHDKGNEYIMGACEIISDAYKHSPIFRVGGDEFVVILEGRDFRNRDALLESVRQEFEATSQDMELEPWRRFSAALGMAIYTHGEDGDVETVFKRADEDMYAAKVAMKANRQ